MKIIQNKFANAILMKGYGAITLYPFIFVRTDVRLSERLINHEFIHGKQQLEMLILPFCLWYIIEWLIRLCIEPKGWAYFNMSFEREARIYEPRPTKRKMFGWVKYLKK